MKRKINKSFIVILIGALSISPSVFSKLNNEINEKDSLNSYYQSVFLGEKKAANYYGAIDSRAIFSDDSGEYWLLDEQFKSRYLDDQIQSEAADLQRFWVKNVVDKSNCPNVSLGENVDYIRYLYRLISMSYIFESLRLYSKTARELGMDKKVCSISFEEIFGKCKPHSDDMKKFKERVFGKFTNEISKNTYSILSKKELLEWFENFQHSTSLSIDPVYSQMHDWCFDHKKNCHQLSMDELREAFSSICNEQNALVNNLCSEEDSLYGVSYSEKATELIQSSNAFNIINRAGIGEECLRRYVKIFSPKELKYTFLGKQFSLISSYLEKKNSRYIQGELFLPGALKEFDIKGLSDFLSALKPPKIEKPIAAIPKPKQKPKPKPVIVVAKPVPEEVPKSEPIKVVATEPAKTKVSEFESKVLELEEKKLSSLDLNMEFFREDFEFTEQMVKDLSAPIKKFQTRAALTDMKSYDQLGSINAPVGLVFLKYLIDTENHQGLFNIVTVLGNKFYVNNDLEKKDKPVYIELKNDASTKNHWQIILLKK